MLRKKFNNIKYNLKRYISFDSLRNRSSLKDVDDGIFNMLSLYKNNNNINLSVINNIIPLYLKECLINDINKTIQCNKNVSEMIENRALNSFNLEKKYWGFLINSYSNCINSHNDYFLLKLYNSLINNRNKIMHISFSLEKKNNKNKRNCLLDTVYNTIKIENENNINYKQIKDIYEIFRPDIIYIDETNNPYNFEYEFIKNLKDINNSIVIVNISNKANLISQNLIPTPFEYSDIVFSFLNENFRAHNSYIVFYKKGFKYFNNEGKLISYDFEEKLKNIFSENNLNNIVFSLATSFKLMKNTEFKEYANQVQKNASILFKYINKEYFNIHYSGNNSFLNLNPSNYSFNVQEFYTLCTKLNIFFDVLSPTKCIQKSFNIGTSYLTSLGLLEKDMKIVADFINQSISLYFHMKQKENLSNEKFIEYINNSTTSEILSLANDVFCFISSFPCMKSF
ncbi:serine hydroxymethyltransferase, putative [Plasmodium gallinaceum]|uniref:Serine hydroxymethyltransferase, putative n=1 Tax=Plasmodium gallinaceum TaxID=5849 RepID=A0A1J1GQE2_PLAGA|nr:serine hydroxymethyltransferase, putative [Plasmodium gallinaceum]CRG94757.1 serine hydroxymethyltransferase, putative [Plasmodium gallinaceum]